MGIDDRHGVVVRAHLGGANRVKNRGGDVAGQTGQILVGLVLHAGFVLFGLVLRQGALADDAACDAQGIGRDLAVFRGAEVIGGNRGGVFKTRRFDLHAAPAGGVQVADAGGEGVEAVQRLAKRVERQGLHVVLDVGVGLVGRRAGERAKLRRGHAHGAAAFEGVFQADTGLAQHRLGHGVERRAPGLAARWCAEFVDRTDLQVVLQVGAHAGQVLHHRDAVLLQQTAGADA